MSQEPTILQLLPLPASDDETLKKSWDYIYEPDPLLDTLLSLYRVAGLSGRR